MESTVSEIVDVRESAVGAAEPSLVHNEETTQQISQNNFGNEQDCERAFSRFLNCVDNSNFLNTSYRERRLEKYSELVSVTESVLAEHDSTYGTNLQMSFWKCRTMAWYVQDVKTWLITLQSNSCRGRWCPMCAEARVNIIAHNCFEFLSQRDVRFLTLTLKHSDLPLSEQIRRVKKCFIRLGRRVFWKRYVTGSIVFLHVKRNLKNTEWHVHLHIFITGSYVPRRWLSAEWLKVTGDSPVVDVRAAHTEKELGQTIRDYARYSGRPANLIDIPAEHRLKVVQAFEGIRVCWKTGICRAVSLSPPKYDKGDSEKRNLGRDITVHRIAASGNMDALKIAFHALAKIPLENARSFRADDDGYDSAGILSPVEPLPKDLFSANERSPPGENACYYEGDVSAENVP